jgi:hypothetical protein
MFLFFCMAPFGQSRNRKIFSYYGVSGATIVTASQISMIGSSISPHVTGGAIIISECQKKSSGKVANQQLNRGILMGVVLAILYASGLFR